MYLGDRTYRKEIFMEQTIEVFRSVKTDCFAYGRLNDKCIILTETVCKKEDCKFYKTKREFEKGRMKDE